MITEHDFTRINNDTNGNPRYVCHFVHLNTQAEQDDYSNDFVSRRYQQALTRAHKLGGRKFHNKQFGGGIAFTTYNLESTCRQINTMMESIPA